MVKKIKIKHNYYSIKVKSYDLGFGGPWAKILAEH